MKKEGGSIGQRGARVGGSPHVPKQKDKRESTTKKMDVDMKKKSYGEGGHGRTATITGEPRQRGGNNG